MLQVRRGDGVRRMAADPADRSPDEPVGLTFPDLPRLELDQLLGQLVERAQEVMATQGRLRGLLRANQVVIGDLALPVLLRRIADAARELVGARYAALGVISPAGGLAEFVHVGMPAGNGDVDRAPAAGQGAAGCADRGSPADPAVSHRRRPALVGLPRRPSAHGQLPGRADPDP